MATDRLTTVLALSPIAFKALHIMAELDRPIGKQELAALMGCSWNTLSDAMTALESSAHKFIASGHKKFVLTQYAKSFLFPSKIEGSPSPKGLPLKDKGNPNMGEQNISSFPDPLLNLLKGEALPSNIEGYFEKVTDFPSKIEGISEVSLGEYDPELRIKQKTYICEMLGLYGKHKAELVSDESISP